MSPNRIRAPGTVVALALVLVPFLLGPPARAQGATTSPSGTSGFTLADALSALPRAPGWQKADLDYQSAADALAAARAGAGLQISAGGSYNRTDSLGSGGRTGSSARLSVSASATVLPWAPVDASIANAETSVEVAALNRTAARVALRLSVVQQYYAARLAASARDVAQAALQQAQAKLTAAQAQHAQGQLSDQGLAQARAALASAQAAFAQASATSDLDRRALFATLGLPPADARLATPPPQAAVPRGTVEVLVRSGVANRPDVQVARLRVRQAQQALAASSAQRWIPAASVSLGVGGSDSTGTQAGLGVSAGLDLQKGTLTGTASYPVAPAPSGAVSTQLSIGASLSIPLDAPSSDAAIRSARTSLASATAALTATERSAALDIRQRYAAVQASQASLAADRASQDAAGQALATARARYAAGLATKLDVGDARVAELQAQRSVEADRNALYLAVLQLRIALGELDATPGGTP